MMSIFFAGLQLITCVDCSEQGEKDLPAEEQICIYDAGCQGANLADVVFHHVGRIWVDDLRTNRRFSGH